MGVEGGLGAAGILLLVLSGIGLAVGLYYAYMCTQSRPKRKRSPHDPEHGPLITADPDVNGNHEDSLAASAPLAYTPKSKIDEPDSIDEKTLLQTKEENDLGVNKSESVFVPIEAETKAEEAVTPTVEEVTSAAATEAADPVVVIPPESMPEYKEPPKTDCLLNKSAESAPTIENGAAPRDCDLPVPMIMNAAMVVAKPITDSDEEDGLLLQKRLHHDDSLDPEPVPPLVPIVQSKTDALQACAAPAEKPLTEDADEPIPSAPPKESTPDAAPDSVLPTAPPKAITPELPATSDENTHPSAPPEEVTIESPQNIETKDNHIGDELQPENGVVYLETYKATPSDPIDNIKDDSIKEENSSTESSPEELAPAGDPVAVVEDIKEVTEIEPVASVEAETIADPIPVTVDSSLPEKNIPVTPAEVSSYGWTEGVIPTDSSSYGWSHDGKKEETDDVVPQDSSTDDDDKSTASSSEDSDAGKPVICNIDKQPPGITEELAVVAEDNKDACIGWTNVADEITIIHPVVEGESIVPLSNDKENLVSSENIPLQIEPEANEKIINISNASISSEEAVPPYTESAEAVKSSTESLDLVVPATEVIPINTVVKDETSPLGDDEVDKIALPKDTEPVIEESQIESVAKAISKIESGSSIEAKAESAPQVEDTPNESSPNEQETEKSSPQLEDASKVTSSNQEAEAELAPEVENIPKMEIASEPEGESKMAPQVEEPIAPEAVASASKLTSSNEEAAAELTPEDKNIPNILLSSEKEGESKIAPQVEEPIAPEAVTSASKLTSSNEEAEAELTPEGENIPNILLSSEQGDESKLAPQDEEPIAPEAIASSESLPEKIETGDSSHVSSVEEAHTALDQQQNTDHSDTESSEPDVSEYSFISGPTDDTTAKVLEDEISISLEPEVTKYTTISTADDTEAADPIVVSTAAGAITITKCDTDSVSSISLSSDDEANEDSEGNKADSDISLSSDEENTPKVDLHKEISDEAISEETETHADIAKQKNDKEQDDTNSDKESDGAENPKESKEEVVEIVQVVQEVEEKDKDNEGENKEDVNSDDAVPQDSSSEASDDDKSTASPNSDDSDADEVPCVKKSKIPRLKSKQSNV